MRINFLIAFVSPLLFLLLSQPAQADEYIYTYCIVTGDQPPVLAGQVIVLSFNLSTAEIALHLKKDNQHEWIAGRNPQFDTGFSVEGSLEDLTLALELRESVVQHEYFRTRSETGISGLNTNDPLPCKFAQ